MLISCKVKSFVFQGESLKEAYLKGCKKLAKYIASDKLTNLTFSVERMESNNFLRFNVYTNLSLSEIQKQYCTNCKNFHCSFFINEEYNCSRCNLKNFLKRCSQKVSISKGYYKHRLSEEL